MKNLNLKQFRFFVLYVLLDVVYSSVGLEHLIVVQEVAGSSPVGHLFGELAEWPIARVC